MSPSLGDIPGELPSHLSAWSVKQTSEEAQQELGGPAGQTYQIYANFFFFFLRIKNSRSGSVEKAAERITSTFAQWRFQ